MLLVFSLDLDITGLWLVERRALPWSLVTWNHWALRPPGVPAAHLLLSPCCTVSPPQGVVNIREGLRSVLSRNPAPREPWILSAVAGAVGRLSVVMATGFSSSLLN